MPPPEIVGAVGGVEIPVEIDACYGSDFACREELFSFCAVWGESVIEADGADFAGFFLGIEDCLAFVFVGCERFFGDDVAAGLHTFNDVFAVIGVNGRNDDFVWFRLGNHFVKVGKGWAVYSYVFFCEFDGPRTRKVLVKII